jgi:hypothetical protein
MYLTVLMDVEDLVDPEADDIAGVCADILAEVGVTATLCIVGEKARLLRDRGRLDVIENLKQHDIGYHTNYHSVHPTISEYLAPLSWDEGVAEALRRERPGVESIHEVFGVLPSCLGGPGNTWGPAACEAMRQLEVAAFVYAYTAVPAGGPHRFAGINAYPNGRSLNDGVYQDDAASDEVLARFKAGIKSDIEAGLQWQQAFVGHPTRILHERFWDDPAFVRGANPPRDMWTAVARKSPDDLERALRNFRRSLQEIRSIPGIELKTIREMNGILGGRTPSPLTPAQHDSVWPGIEKRVLGMSGWVIVPSDIDLTGLAAQTRALLPTLESYSVL